MDLGLSDEQRALVASFGNLLAKGAAPEAVRAAEPGGFDEDLWGLLLGTGALFMAVPEDRGGWGATLLDLAIVAELLGRYLAPAPLIECQVAARLLAKIATKEALSALQSVLHGHRIVTLALHPPRGRGHIDARRRRVRRGDHLRRYEAVPYLGRTLRAPPSGQSRCLPTC